MLSRASSPWLTSQRSGLGVRKPTLHFSLFLTTGQIFHSIFQSSFLITKFIYLINIDKLLKLCHFPHM